MTANHTRPQNVQQTSVAAYYAHQGKDAQCQRLAAYYLRTADLNADATDLEAAQAFKSPASTISARRNDILKTIERQGYYLLDGKQYRLKQRAPRKSRVNGGRTANPWTIDEVTGAETVSQTELSFNTFNII